jgi:hypothetical protein
LLANWPNNFASGDMAGSFRAEKGSRLKMETGFAATSDRKRQKTGGFVLQGAVPRREAMMPGKFGRLCCPMPPAKVF